MRISKIEYAMRIAEAAACRSEDPFYQVGAAAMSADGRIVATGYNGLPPGVQAGPTWWNDKEKRKPYVIHAETNLCSMFRRGEVAVVCVTLMPCPDCMRILAAHDVKEVYYHKHHNASYDSGKLAEFWGVKLRWLDASWLDTPEKPGGPYNCDFGVLDGYGGGGKTECPNCSGEK